MERKNGGFTLIELLIAITVLSVMTGVLLQAFVVGRRMNVKAAVSERIQERARKTMEEMKGFSFERLDALLEESGEEEEAARVSIAGSEYEFKKMETGAWELTLACRKDGAPSGGGKADYFIRVTADPELYGDETVENVYSVNEYKAPNLADVSSFQNIVLKPDAVTQADALLTEQLLIEANQDDEEDDEGEAGEGTGEPVSSEGGGQSLGTYDKDDVTRVLTVKADGSGEMLSVSVSLTGTLTVSGEDESEDTLTMEQEILRAEKRVVLNKKISAR